MQTALDVVGGQFGKTYPLVIGGRKLTTQAVLTSTNPSEPSEVVGMTAMATREHADAALEAAWSAFQSWSSRAARRDPRSRCVAAETAWPESRRRI